MARVAVVGATSWGSTLAVLLARNGHETRLLCRSAAEAASLTRERQSPRRPGLVFPENLTASADPRLLAEADLVVLAVPSESLAANLVQVVAFIAPDASVLSASKGLEWQTGRRLSEVICESGIEPERVLALSGPNFAAEIAAGLPAATVIAGADAERARRAQALLTGPTFRVYTSHDIVGVELGAALKNVVAIACGLSDGLGYGYNARAALMTRSLAEIMQLGLAAGARAVTFLGLAGMGDLVLTCQSDLSRNRRLGLALATGLDLEAALGSIDGVVEGAETARAVPQLAQRFGVELPVCSALHDLLYDNLSPKEAIARLMARPLKPEFPADLEV
jgi:glycerol-3-phosphate dehydrogenase (NAD(P)+)